MPKFDAATEVEKLNNQLKLADTGVAVKLIGKKLYLTATLPPKPGGRLSKPRNQRIALGVFANAAGLKRAKADALKLSSELAMDTFCWDNWAPSKATPVAERTLPEWAKLHEEAYFDRRERNSQSWNTYYTDYLAVYRHLPKATMDVDLLRAFISNRTEPDTRNRARYCKALTALCRFADVTHNFNDLRGSYSATAVNPRELPSDEEIEQYWQAIKNPQWRNIYGLMAVFGLRNHETFRLDYSTLKDGIATVKEDTKTGFHEAWPYHPHWLEKFGLANPNLDLPNIKYDIQGAYVSTYFGRQGIPFSPYNLRHAWAARTATAYGLEVDIAARMMGHSVEMHTRIYHRFIRREQMEQAVQRSLRHYSPPQPTPEGQTAAPGDLSKKSEWEEL